MKTCKNGRGQCYAQIFGFLLLRTLLIVLESYRQCLLDIHFLNFFILLENGTSWEWNQTVDCEIFCCWSLDLRFFILHFDDFIWFWTTPKPFFTRFNMKLFHNLSRLHNRKTLIKKFKSGTSKRRNRETNKLLYHE